MGEKIKNYVVFIPNRHDYSIEQFCNKENVKPLATITAFCRADDMFESPEWKKLEELVKDIKNVTIIVVDAKQIEPAFPYLFWSKHVKLNKMGIKMKRIKELRPKLGKVFKKGRGI